MTGNGVGSDNPATLTTAENIANYFVGELVAEKTWIPPWDFDAPGTQPVDTSAAAIAADGLVMLSTVAGGTLGAMYLTDAEDILGALSGYFDTSGDAVLTDGYTGDREWDEYRANLRRLLFHRGVAALAKRPRRAAGLGALLPGGYLGRPGALDLGNVAARLRGAWLCRISPSPAAVSRVNQVLRRDQRARESAGRNRSGSNRVFQRLIGRYWRRGPRAGETKETARPLRLYHACRLRRARRSRRLRRAAAPRARNNRPAAEAARPQDTTRKTQLSENGPGGGGRLAAGAG